MRTRAVVLSVLASAGVLFLGWELGTTAQQPHAATSAPPTNSTGGPGTTPTGGPTPTGAATPEPTASSGGLNDGTYPGATEDTRFGPVQVEVVVAGGRITDVKALQLTNYGGRSVQLSNYAAPILRSEVLKAQSARVSSVSGATYTTDGYLSSLQSALDKAKA